MPSPFPTLTPEERGRLALHRINPDVSLLEWLTRLNGPVRARELMTVQPSALDGWADDLSPRELEILILYAQGEQETAIAKQLHLSRHTVYAHMRMARYKLGARTIAHAVHLAHVHGAL